ncbi:hypothetical protein K458DRAFT_417718 [Lentithecium fluviatile CBS 122367]|uniref:Uncharacterized protein n=1 Tax=Lentithecium fluviatile CBS 122367 TaxID=1168545 RepID=A0A6G1J3S7_9PLEO|nr:hypothetical protein K458DRAFT_417718 [Lentithecium fluviatile CBS 122367]
MIPINATITTNTTGRNNVWLPSGNPSYDVYVSASPLAYVPPAFWHPRSVCLLQPINGGVFLAEEFEMLALLGVAGTAVASAVRWVWVWVWMKLGALNDRRGSRGGFLRMLRVLVAVVGTVGSWFLGPGAVIGVAWKVAKGAGGGAEAGSPSSSSSIF